MDRQLAQKLLKIVNNKELFDILNEYAEHRINVAKEYLTVAPPSDVLGWQATVRELRRFATLRDEVLKIGEKNG